MDSSKNEQGEKEIVRQAEDQTPASTSSSWHRSSMSNARFVIEKFDGTNNFGMWQCEVQDLLFREGSNIALESKPENLSNDDWKFINRQACSTIRLCLAKDQKYFVMKETMASSLWKKLEDKYMTKSVENRLYLKKKLFRFHYKIGTPMIEHLDNFNKILADLQNLDVEIIDEDKALLLLNSLPETYDHLTTTLLYGKDEVKFTDVSNALVNNEYRKKDQNDHRDSAPEALTVTRGRTNNRKSGGSDEQGRSHLKSEGSSRRRPAKDECAYCHEKGHWKKDCPNRDNSNANVARRTDDEDDSAFSVTALVDSSDRWILDSGCSYHMCPNRQWFSSFESIDGGLVLMGNDKVCRTKGIGTIRLKMHDGTIRQLTGVKYVPDLKKNLISLGVLDSSGYKVTIQGGVLKVVRGALLAMKGIRERNLYFLDGYTVSEKAFRLWNSASKKIVIGRNVAFDESVMLKQKSVEKENQKPNSHKQVEFEIPVTPKEPADRVEFDDQDDSSVETEVPASALASASTLAPVSVPAPAPLQKTKPGYIGAFESEREQQLRSLMDRIAKMETDLQAAEPLKVELQQARADAQVLLAARQELVSKVQDLNQDLQKVHVDMQQFPGLMSELENLRQEYQHCRATYDHEKQLYNDHLESLQVMEKDYITMAREVEILRAELTNSANVDRKTGLPYGGHTGYYENDAIGHYAVSQNAYDEGYGLHQGHGPLPGLGGGAPTSSAPAASGGGTPHAGDKSGTAHAGDKSGMTHSGDKSGSAHAGDKSGTAQAGDKSGTAPARPSYDVQRGSNYNAHRGPGGPSYDAQRGIGGPVYDAQRGFGGPGYDPQRVPSGYGYDAHRGHGILGYDARRVGGISGYDAQRGPVGPTYDAQSGGGYDMQSGPGYDMQSGSSYDAQRGSGYDAQRGSGYDAQRGPGYDGQRGPGYDGQKGPGYEAHRVA